MENVSIFFLLISLLFCLPVLFYPILSLLRSILFKNKVNRSSSFLEPVSIIIACYNEERYIKNKIESILNEGEWIIGSELIIISCGSTDKTNEILLAYGNRDGVILLFSDERLSKIKGVNLCVEKAKHEFLVFSDCRQIMKEGSIRRLIQNFNDPNVGTVAGTLIDTKREVNPSFFRSMFNTMALNDSITSSSLNIYGALYAQRKSVFRKIPEDLLFDDLFVVVSTLSQKKRLIQEEKAIIYDENFTFYYQKERIARLVRGLLLLLFNHPKLIFSIPKKTLLRFLVYKYFKLLIPYGLVLMMLSTLVLIYLNNVSGILYFFLALMCLLCFFKKTRDLILFFLRVNYFFVISTIFYLFRDKKSNRWEKLKTS